MTDKIENPYQSPLAALGEVVMVTPPRYKIWASVVGAIVDVVVSNVLGIVVGIVFALRYLRPGVSPEQLQRDVSESAAMLVIMLIVGSFGTFVGGFVAAWLGKCFPLRHALGAGVLSMSLGVAIWLIFSQSVQLGVLGFALTVPMALLGGYARSKVADRAR